MASVLWFSLILVGISNGIILPNDIINSKFRQECPNHNHVLEFCAAKFEECIGVLLETQHCTKQFCKCSQRTTINEDPFVSTCSNFTGLACITVLNHGERLRESILEHKKTPAVLKIRKKLEMMNEGLQNVLKKCLIEKRHRLAINRSIKNLNSTKNVLLEVILPYLIMTDLESSMIKSKDCKTAIHNLKQIMEQTDETTVTHLNIPYDLWYIGAEFGALGKVAMRVVAEEACGVVSVEFNHLSTIWVNCYDRKNDKEICDEQFLRHIKKTLSAMKSNKATCKLMVDLIEILLPLRSNLFYQEASRYYVESKVIRLGGKFNRGFDGSMNGSIAKRDTKNPILSLSTSPTSSLKVFDLVELVSWHCPNVRSVITSCGFKYEYCNERAVQNECGIEFATCLGGLDGVSASCEQKIEHLRDLLWPIENFSKNPAFLDHELDSRVWSSLATVCLVMIILGSLVFFILDTRKPPRNNISCLEHSGDENPLLTDSSHEENVKKNNNSNGEVVVEEEMKFFKDEQ